MSKSNTVRTVVTAANEYLAAVKNIKNLGLDHDTTQKVMGPKIEYMLAACEAVMDEFDETEITLKETP